MVVPASGKYDEYHPCIRMADVVFAKIQDDGWSLFFAITSKIDGNKLEWDIHMVKGEEEKLKFMLESVLAKMDEIIATRQVH